MVGDKSKAVGEEFRDIKKGSKRRSWDSKQPRALEREPDVCVAYKNGVDEMQPFKGYGEHRLCARTGQKRQKVGLKSLSLKLPINAITGTKYMQRVTRGQYL
ncbi:hypothetical protein Rs2_47249 [Raphanus sativus]|nr:hypothetical protein Rs2_47249 [Raphanus sativus]